MLNSTSEEKIQLFHCDRDLEIHLYGLRHAFLRLIGDLHSMREASIPSSCLIYLLPFQSRGREWEQLPRNNQDICSAYAPTERTRVIATCRR